MSADMSLSAWIDGVGLLAPGLPDWPTARPCWPAAKPTCRPRPCCPRPWCCRPTNAAAPAAWCAWPWPAAWRPWNRPA
jgi:hypothetical protein